METNSAIPASEALAFKDLAGDTILFWYFYVFVLSAVFAYSPTYSLMYGGNRLSRHAFPFVLPVFVQIVVIALLKPPLNLEETIGNWPPPLFGSRSYPYAAYLARWEHQMDTSPFAATFLFFFKFSVFELAPWLALIWPIFITSNLLRNAARIHKMERTNPAQYAALARSSNAKDSRMTWKQKLAGILHGYEFLTHDCTKEFNYECRSCAMGLQARIEEFKNRNVELNRVEHQAVGELKTIEAAEATFLVYDKVHVSR